MKADMRGPTCEHIALARALPILRNLLCSLFPGSLSSTSCLPSFLRLLCAPAPAPAAAEEEEPHPVDEEGGSHGTRCCLELSSEEVWRWISCLVCIMSFSDQNPLFVLLEHFLYLYSGGVTPLLPDSSHVDFARAISLSPTLLWLYVHFYLDIFRGLSLSTSSYNLSCLDIVGIMYLSYYSSLHLYVTH